MKEMSCNGQFQFGGIFNLSLGVYALLDYSCPCSPWGGGRLLLEVGSCQVQMADLYEISAEQRLAASITAAVERELGSTPESARAGKISKHMSRGLSDGTLAAGGMAVAPEV